MISIYYMKNIFNKKEGNKVCISGCKKSRKRGEISKYGKNVIINEAKKKNYSLIQCCIITSFKIWNLVWTSSSTPLILLKAVSCLKSSCSRSAKNCSRFWSSSANFCWDAVSHYQNTQFKWVFLITSQILQFTP